MPREARCSSSSASLAVGLGLELFANVYSWLSTDCDGPVAVDQLSGPPEATTAYQPGATPAIAGVGNHLYVFAAGTSTAAPAQVSVH